MFAFITRILNDDDMTNDGRVYALPFLLSAWGIGTAAGVVGIIKGEGVIDVVSTMALIGFSLYTGNKFLELRGKSSSPAPSETPTGEERSPD
jgi:hypothetical protein